MCSALAGHRQTIPCKSPPRVKKTSGLVSKVWPVLWVLMPERRDDHLVGITVIWVGLLAFIAWGYVFQTPPGGPYTDFMRKAFAVLLAVVVPSVSALILVSWVLVLRQRRL